ncbi:hypothetical protein ACWQEN_001632 [Morganella morganii]|uniref:hypothetical protein n=1 Tax=Morganella morganii TaxID=582 RepID=UPI001E38FFE8|nr:hypothetical protein [Morganella morganii]EKU5841388.1 hypothetical protein [Morganella morganii]UFH69295.1 hypothetical protein KQH80_04450 [Morganella morganii]
MSLHQDYYVNKKNTTTRKNKYINLENSYDNGQRPKKLTNKKQQDKNNTSQMNLKKDKQGINNNNEHKIIKNKIKNQNALSKPSHYHYK